MEAKSLKPPSPESEENLPEKEVSTEENRDKKNKGGGTPDPAANQVNSTLCVFWLHGPVNSNSVILKLVPLFLEKCMSPLPEISKVTKRLKI